MRFAQTHHTYTLILACLLAWCGPTCSFLMAQSSTGWLSSQSLLEQAAAKPAEPDTSPWLKSTCLIITQSLRNPEQHQQLASLQARNRDLAPAQDPIFLDAYGLKPKLEAASEYEISKTMQSFLEREAKTSAMPESMKKGLSFDFGTRDTPTPSPTTKSKNVRYGLILTSIEPSPIPFRLASIAHYDEYSLVPYAPKADLQYRVGAIYSENEETPRAQWNNSQPETDKLFKIPDLHFKAKLVPRGQMTAKQIVPPQSLS
ncbi:MAG: hypothetical protein NTX25_16595, partial [Proteobacteria bacterium]|nr:hypothetical protein [Pseudomonadota bacterium]